MRRACSCHDLVGFEFNSTLGVLRIPSLKAQVLALIEQVVSAASSGSAVPWSILSSLHGKLMWASTDIELGRSYLSAVRQPLDTVASLLINRLQRAIFLNLVAQFPELLAQLRWWAAALSLNDGATNLYINKCGMYDR